MEITHAFLAELAKADTQGNVNAIGIFNQVRAKEFPAPLPPCTLIVMLDMTGEDLTVVHKLSVVMRGGDPEETHIMGDTEMLFRPVVPTEDPVSAQVIATIREGPLLGSAGIYNLEFFIDQEHKYSTAFRVYVKAGEAVE